MSSITEAGAMEALLVDLFVEAHAKPPRQIAASAESPETDFLLEKSW